MQNMQKREVKGNHAKDKEGSSSMSITTRLYVWLLDRHILTVHPWEDPRRSPEDRAAWIQAEPKSLKGKAV